MDKSIYTREYAVLLSILRKRREESEFTQVDLAKKLGVTQSTYSKLERGDRRIDMIQLRTIGGMIGFTLMDFVKEFEREICKPVKKRKKTSRRK